MDDNTRFILEVLRNDIIEIAEILENVTEDTNDIYRLNQVQRRLKILEI